MRWHILKTLLHKEALRHATNRGGPGPGRACSSPRRCCWLPSTRPRSRTSRPPSSAGSTTASSGTTRTATGSTTSASTTSGRASRPTSMFYAIDPPVELEPASEVRDRDRRDRAAINARVRRRSRSTACTSATRTATGPAWPCTRTGSGRSRTGSFTPGRREQLRKRGVDVDRAFPPPRPGRRPVGPAAGVPRPVRALRDSGQRLSVRGTPCRSWRCRSGP